MGSNPTGSNSDRLVSITRIDGYIMSDKYDMEFPATISGAPEVVSLPPSNSKGVISTMVNDQLGCDQLMMASKQRWTASNLMTAAQYLHYCTAMDLVKRLRTMDQIFLFSVVPIKYVLNVILRIVL